MGRCSISQIRFSFIILSFWCASVASLVESWLIWLIYDAAKQTGIISNLKEPDNAAYRSVPKRIISHGGYARK